MFIININYIAKSKKRYEQKSKKNRAVCDLEAVILNHKLKIISYYLRIIFDNILKYVMFKIFKIILLLIIHNV